MLLKAKDKLNNLIDCDFGANVVQVGIGSVEVVDHNIFLMHVCLLDKLQGGVRWSVTMGCSCSRITLLKGFHDV